MSDRITTSVLPLTMIFLEEQHVSPILPLLMKKQSIMVIQELQKPKSLLQSKPGMARKLILLQLTGMIYLAIFSKLRTGKDLKLSMIMMNLTALPM